MLFCNAPWPRPRSRREIPQEEEQIRGWEPAEDPVSRRTRRSFSQIQNEFVLYTARGINPLLPTLTRGSHSRETHSPAKRTRF